MAKNFKIKEDETITTNIEEIKELIWHFSGIDVRKDSIKKWFRIRKSNI